MADRPDHAILYDRDWGFCLRMLNRIMRWDRRGRLRPVAIQSAEGDRLLASVPPDQRLDSWHLVAPDGSVSSAGAAAPRLARLLPAGALPAAALAAFPAVTERAYRWVAGHRDLLGRFFALALVVLVVAGCGSSVQEGSRLTVYLGGSGSGASGDVADGAELALEQAGGTAAEVPVDLEVLSNRGAGESAGGLAQAQIAAGARTASQDSTAIAYLGEPASDATAISLPITNEAGILQVATGPVAEDLLREPGGNDVPGDFQTTGERTLIGLLAEGEKPPVADPAFEAEFEGAYDRRPGISAAYGYEAMSLVLDSIGRSEEPLDRLAVIAAALATDDRDSVLGTYSIDPAGLATLGADSGAPAP